MRRGALIFLAVALAGCGGGGKADGEATVVIDAGERAVEVAVEVADSREERARGLMERDELAEDAGMIFLYDDETSGGFWMKNTRIPLSIAFYGEGGEILRLLDMEPCRSDPCPFYDPGVSYRGALEVNRGAFERWGVEEGDVLRVQGP